MKVSGNANAAEWFRAHGTGNYKDAKAKYTSSAGVKYRDRVRQLADEDARRFPQGIVIDSSVAAVAEAAVTPAKDDFFSDWGTDENNTQTPTSTSSPFTAQPPSHSQPAQRGRSPGPPITPVFTAPPAKLASEKSFANTNIDDDFKDFDDQPDSFSQPPPPPSNPNRARSPSPTPAKVVAQPQFSAAPVSSVVAKPSGGGGLGAKKLGAKKATKIINFDEAERRAKEEEERQKKEDEERK
ncbi:ADP-ribosylation factor GTPase activating protein, ER-Golgi transport, partial [Rhizoclosmatium hyalinum]